MKSPGVSGRFAAAAGLYIFVLPCFLRCQEPEQAVGLVLSANEAKLRRAGTELPLTARTGDILFPGDSLLGAVTVLYCPEKISATLSPAAEALLESKQLKLRSGQISAKKSEPLCVLPRLERESVAGQKHLGASLTRNAAVQQSQAESLEVRLEKLPERDRTALKAELEPIDKALAINGRDLAARVSRAAVFEKYHMTASALDEYRKLQGESPDAVWIRSRLFVHEEEQAASAPAKAAAEPGLSGRTHALLVGISKYQIDRISSLRYAHEDAALFEKHLRSPRGGGLTDADITILTDEKATLAAVRTAFDTLLKSKAGKQDTILLFFAAHGTTTDKGVGYIITHDSDPQDLESTALPMRDVQRLFREELTHVGRVLLYVDVCHAGTIGSVQPRSNRINTLVENLTDEGEMFGMLASRKDEVAVEGPQFGGGHGAFSYFLLDALNGAADANNNKVVDAIEIVEYVSDRVKEATAARQHPKEIGNAGTTSLAVISKPGIPLQPYNGPVLVASRSSDAQGSVSRSVTPVSTSSRPAVSDALKSFEEALSSGRLLPDVPGSAFAALAPLRRQLNPEEYLLQENRLRVALEEKGQQILLQYLKGDQVPQNRADFMRGAAYFSTARLLTPESLLLEARENFCLGRAALFAKEYAKAAELLERAVRIDSTGAYSYNALGISYLEQAKYQEAILAFRDATRRAPWWAYPLHNMALAYTQLGDYDSAIASYERAIRLAPDFSYLPYNLGLIYQRINRRKEAEAAYQQAIEIAPDLGEPYNALGYLKASLGRREEAERLYRLALAKNPDLLAARHNLALVLAQDPSKVPEALGLWKENLTRSADYTPSRLSLARALARLGKSAEAAEEYRQLIAVRPEYVAARRALAEIYAGSARYDDALEELRQALKTQSANPLLYEQIGDIERTRGNQTSALEAWNKALGYSGDSDARKRLRRKIKG